MKTALGSRKLAAPPAGLNASSFKGTLSFGAATPLLPPPAPPAGSYDAVVGLSLDAGNLALDAVYQSGTVPHQIALDQLLSATDLTALGGGFVPDKSGGTITRLHITSAPTLAETTDGSPIVALLIPIQIDFTRSSFLLGRQISTLVTKAVGTMQLTMSLMPDVIIQPLSSNSSLTISVQLVADVESPATSPRLTLDPSSPVQLKTQVPPDQIDGLAVIIQNALALQFNNNLSFTVSPLITLPTGNLEIRHVDVLARGSALLAGVQILGTQGTADTGTLTNLLPNQNTNIFVWVQDVVANQLVQNALNSGQLTAAAQQQHDNAVVESASAKFQNNAFVAQVSGKLVNECLDSIDLGFIETRTVTIKLEGTSIEIDQHDDNSIAEWSNTWCLLASLGLIALAALGGALLGGVFPAIVGGILGFVLTGVGPFLGDQIISGIFSGGSGPNSTIVNLTRPIPGSDSLPTLSNAFINITDGAALIAAAAATTADDVNTIIYARFLVPLGGIDVFSTEPLTGVKVELMDQDAPAPAGDDASTVPPPDTSSLHGKYGVSVTNTFVPPSADERLDEGTTDLDGTVRFALLTDQLQSTAGRIKTVTTHFDTDTDRDTTTTTYSPVPEAKPDLYFRVTMPGGKVVDTRGLPGGFMENFTSARVGTLANPIIFTFGGNAGEALEATTS